MFIIVRYAVLTVEFNYHRKDSLSPSCSIELLFIRMSFNSFFFTIFYILLLQREYIFIYFYEKYLLYPLHVTSYFYLPSLFLFTFYLLSFLPFFLFTFFPLIVTYLPTYLPLFLISFLSFFLLSMYVNDWVDVNSRNGDTDRDRDRDINEDCTALLS